MADVKLLDDILASDADVSANTARKLLHAANVPKILEKTFDKTSGGTITGSTSITGDLSVTGNITGLTVTPSDRRLKKDLKPLADVLERLNSMTGYSYEMRGRDKRQIGLIAQDVERAFPEAVHTFTLDGEVYLGVIYTSLVPVLVEAVKVLSARVAALEAAQK